MRDMRQLNMIQELNLKVQGKQYQHPSYHRPQLVGPVFAPNAL